MELTFERLVSLFTSKLKYIIIVSLIAAVGAFFISTNVVKKEYTSSSRLLIMMNATTTQSGVNELSITQNLVANYIITLDTDNFFKVATDAINKKYKTEFDYTIIKDRTTIDGNYTEENSELNIRYTCGDSLSAQLILEVIDAEAISYIDKLGFPNELLIINNPTLPIAPSSPNVKNNMAYAFIIAFIICVCIVYFKEIFDDRIKSTNDISKYNLKIVGIIPNYIKKQTLGKKIKKIFKASKGAKR